MAIKPEPQGSAGAGAKRQTLRLGSRVGWDGAARNLNASHARVGPRSFEQIDSDTNEHTPNVCQNARPELDIGFYPGVTHLTRNPPKKAKTNLKLDLKE
jgi:hypothetical protein